MNIIKSFNDTIDYIETTLDGEIEPVKVLHLSGYSLAMFSRIFSILTQMTLTEYMRCRKLTEAAITLQNTDEKIIDIALKYGYESPDAFGYAFKKFHGYSPMEVRKGAQFNIISRVQLALSIQGGRNMNITIQQKPKFYVAGIKSENIDTSQCSVLWEKLFSKYSHEQLASLGNGQSYGMCFDVENVNNINYMACYEVTELDKAIEMGLEVMEIAEAQYAVFQLQGKIPDCIHEAWKYVMEVFFPQQGYMHSGAPDFEVYSEGDMYSSDYKMQLWIPVIQTK